MYVAAETALTRLPRKQSDQPTESASTVWIDICADTAPGWIPGAQRIAFDDIVASRGDTSGLLPSIEALNAVLAHTGIRSHAEIMIYDDQNGLCASRLAWTLNVCGLESVQIVDGGRSALVAAGAELTRSPTPAEPMPRPLAYRDMAYCDAESIRAHLDDPQWQIVDARSLEEYSGADVRSRVGGHIPGALHFDWRNCLRDEQSGLLLGAEELRQKLQDAGIDPNRTTCVYCQTHRRSSVLFGVMKTLGFRDVRGYPGAWSDWGNRTDLPVETGQ